MKLTTAVVAAALLVGSAAPAAAQSDRPSRSRLDRPAAAKGTVVVPDRFLRRWDPVTVFFAGDVGPVAGGPEDQPERFVTLSPSHPGAFTWLDARTLQFRPAEPWPPLVRFTWTVEGKRSSLATLMEAPVQTVPAAEAEGLEEIEAISLTFPEPLDADALRRMARIELRPLPGVGREGGRVLTGDDFAIKVLERGGRSAPATYVLELATPIPLGTRAIVRLRLSLDDEPGRSFAGIAFSTAEPFRVVSLGCGSLQLPVTPGGSRYEPEQALRCEAEVANVTVRFSSPPAALGPVETRNLLRFTPAVEGLEFTASGNALVARGPFARERLYRVTLTPVALADSSGRALDMRAASEAFVVFPRQSPYLSFAEGSGIVERLGPQAVPLTGRGDERVDLRIHHIDPLDRAFWPFPSYAVRTDDSDRPPGPGEGPEPGRFPDGADAFAIAGRIVTLGSPSVSTIVALPLAAEGAAARFGLDLAPHLARAGGAAEPGTYLIGLRRLSGGSMRVWMRVQVTDLALATLEEPLAVRFVVTSLATARPVAGARVRVDAGSGAWQTLFEGVTDAAGAVRWPAPGARPGIPRPIRRIVVEKDRDTLTLDPERPPDGYHEGRWSPTHTTWLQWAVNDLIGRAEEPRWLCHIFTERPVYRPEEKVHIKGWLRERFHGGLVPVVKKGMVIVEGPSDLVWRLPIEVNAAGGFYTPFAAENLPTGVYRARFEDNNGYAWGSVAFRMEAYRIPEFEVQLAAPQRSPLDREFTVALTATYYAGGRVAARPVRWRVTQFPYSWQPAAREGFRFSSDARYSSVGRFEASPALLREDTTDGDGGARLVINPAIETTAQPRTYVVEATVTGADDQTVTAVEQVVALPPFVLGLKAPRYLEKAVAIEPEVLVLGPDDKPLAGQVVTVRLLHRQWHSVLQASDFSEGKARYLTDVVDEKVFETTVTSAGEATRLSIPISTAGVYVVELESADRLGRSQRVAVDLYAGGGEPVGWAKPATAVFTMSTDKPAYEPGDTAHVVVQSPFQRAAALAVVEAPDGNEYRWVAVEGGAATVDVPVSGRHVPELPVHVVLMRGRIPGTAPTAGSSQDLGKPATMASSVRLKVKPLDNTVVVELEHPERALPGQEVPLTVTLADPQGRPLPGEVTLWLVDQAVLALGREQRLDPLPDFITPVLSRLDTRDTRNLAFGQIAFAELPGGDVGEREEGLLARTTVRRRFESVPYYEPALRVGPEGAATVLVKLPDNLTNFKVRAKAACGPDRFGAGGSQIAVRLPVIVQPALPRFVRPGDSFTAAAIGRVVEGEGGPGVAEVEVEGVTIVEAAPRELTWAPNEPNRIELGVDVPTPDPGDEALPRPGRVTFRVAVARSSDGARDAFEVSLPVREDRRPVVVRTLAQLERGTPLVLPALPGPARPGTVRRTVLMSDQPGLIRMAAGLNFLLTYPYGCTEQRVATARSHVALRRFRDALAQSGDDARIDRAVRDTLDWLPRVIDSSGLAGYWPGSRGYVSLTAWVVQFLVEARDAGYPVEGRLLDPLLRSLEQALRSDYGRFIDGESFAERCWALVALTQAGRFNAGYAAELARKAQFLDLEGVAAVLASFARSGDTSSTTSRALADRLWDGVVVRLWQGRETYGGLQATATARNGLILPSETRTLSELTRSLARAQGSSPKLQLLVDAIVTLGRDDGWGTTNANAAALLALSELLEPGFAAGEAAVIVRSGGGERRIAIGKDAPLGSLVTRDPGAVELSLAAGGKPVVVRAETSWVPLADGSQAAPESAGFVVSREALRQLRDGEPPERIALEQAGRAVDLAVGDVVEEHVQVVNPGDRFYVAIAVPLAAGMEPLNPELATAPPEARPSRGPTLPPTYAAFLDDAVTYYYDSLPKGTYDFYFRTRATTAGRFIQPPAQAELMYDGAVRGAGAGARVVITRR